MIHIFSSVTQRKKKNNPETVTLFFLPQNVKITAWLAVAPVVARMSGRHETFMTALLGLCEAREVNNLTENVGK